MNPLERTLDSEIAWAARFNRYFISSTLEFEPEPQQLDPAI